jgi:ribonuclease P protein component
MVMWLEKAAGTGLRRGGASGEDGLRLGVVASRRSFRRAVDRARAKRMLREAYRLNRHRFGAAGVVVLVARPALLAAHLASVEQDLLSLADRGRIMGEGRD